jgi:hypothetical protein
MKWQNGLKIVAGTLVIIGIVLSFFERRYAPQTMVGEGSPNYPDWLSSIGWWLPSTAAIVYILIDILILR